MTSLAEASAAGQAGSTLADAPVGVVPIVWNNADLFDLAPEVPAALVLDEIVRLGYAGCQWGRGFPEGSELRAELDARGLRLAERYVALPALPEGPAPGAAEAASEQLARLADGGGEVLVVALDASPERDRWSGRTAEGAPAWPADAFARLAELLERLAARAPAEIRVCFHPHSATWIEGPAEVDALAVALEGSPVGLCLDVGHYLVGGGDPAAAVRRYGRRIGHVHLKDVDPGVLAALRGGSLAGFRRAIRARLFTELGAGILDLAGVLEALETEGYRGWLMVEQDSTRLPASEAAAIGRRVLGYALRSLAAGRGAR